MRYFDPSKPIVVRTEASYHDGLSGGLFQVTEKGLPVHFISCTLTDTEKRYNQTEKETQAGHKPLILMFNKPAAKSPHRIKNWVMDLQDVN